MKGFSGILSEEAGQRLVRSYGQYNDKFPSDKANYSDDSYDIMLDGVVLNASALLDEYDRENMASLLAAMWETQGVEMLSVLKGSYVLSIWDKRRDMVLVTGDRLNKRPLYYCIREGKTFFSSRYLDLVALLAENGIYPPYSHAAFAMLQSIGYLYDRITPLQGVYRLRPFEYLLFRDGKTSLEGGEGPVKEAEASQKELMKRFDELFARAVRLQYEKNVQGGYQQTASLSGGMDTRSTVLMGKRLGYTLDQSFCYCQSGGMDEKIARTLANELNAPFFFYALDGGHFLLRPEEHGRRNECQMSYGGATGAFSVSEALPMERVGIIHTGSFGGEIMNCIFDAKDTEPPRVPFSGEAGEEFSACLRSGITQSRMHLNHLMQGCLNFARMFESRGEPLSPFMDEDVYAFLCTVPFAMRKGRGFYARWMQQYLPNRLPTTFFGLPMNAPYFMLYLVPRLSARMPALFRFDKVGMNPYQRWYDEQPELRQGLREFVDKYGQNCLPLEIRQPILKQCENGKAQQIMYGISGLLAAWLTEEAMGKNEL